jgi:DNA modification methylase
MILPKPYFQDDAVTIYNADCRDIIPELPKVDLVLTDPPYGLKQNAFRVKNREKLAKTTNYGDFNWDVLVERPLIDKVVAAGKYAAIFGGNYYGLNSNTCWLIWDKDNSGDFADCEMAWTNLPGAIRRLVWRWNGMLQEPGSPKEQRVHPTQKPLPVMKWAISKAKEKTHEDFGLILDPFCGSGTSLVAAKSMGIRSIGIEIEEKYCEIAVERLRQSVMDLKV